MQVLCECLMTAHTSLPGAGLPGCVVDDRGGFLSLKNMSLSSALPGSHIIFLL